MINRPPSINVQTGSYDVDANPYAAGTADAARWLAERQVGGGVGANLAARQRNRADSLDTFSAEIQSRQRAAILDNLRYKEEQRREYENSFAYKAENNWQGLVASTLVDFGAVVGGSLLGGPAGAAAALAAAETVNSKFRQLNSGGGPGGDISLPEFAGADINQENAQKQVEQNALLPSVAGVGARSGGGGVGTDKSMGNLDREGRAERAVRPTGNPHDPGFSGKSENFKGFDI